MVSMTIVTMLGCAKYLRVFLRKSIKGTRVLTEMRALSRERAGKAGRRHVEHKVVTHEATWAA